MTPNIIDTDDITAKRRVVKRSGIGNAGSLSHFVTRPNIGTRGKSIHLRTNHFRVEFDSNMAIYHYDVSIESIPQMFKMAASGDDRKRLTKCNLEVNRRIVQRMIDENSKDGDMFSHIIPVYDGSKNLYTMRPLFGVSKDVNPIRFNISTYDENDADALFVASLKFTGNVISLNTLNMYLNNKSGHIPLPAIQALDIIMRHGPSLSKIPIGAALFLKEEDDSRINIGGGKQLSFGYYQSLRPCVGGAHLVVDRSCTVFYSRCSIEDFVRKMFPYKDREPITEAPKWNDAERKRIERELKGLKIEVTHLNYKRKYTVKGLSRESASEIYFDWYKTGRRGEKIHKGYVSVAQYFQQEYHSLRHPQLPCINVRGGQKPIYFPIEVCRLVEDQSVNRRKLTMQQTADMIRICASTSPKERFDIIESAAKDIARNTESAPFLREFNIQINTHPIHAYGRVLNAPELFERNEKRCALRDGKWRINQFYRPMNIYKWIIVNVSNIEDSPINNFVMMIRKIGSAFGMVISEPLCRVKLYYQRGTLKERVFDIALEKYGPIDMIVFIGLETDIMYREIKRVGDVDCGIATQCVRKQNVHRLSQSMVSNLLLKINMKMGGENVIIGPMNFPNIRSKNMIVIGADVAHPSPSEKLCASVAAVVGTLDENCSRHYPTVRVQPRLREEIITEIDDMVSEVITEYERENGQLPQEIVFFRDGVSEGQFRHVMEFEVNKMKQMFLTHRVDYKPKVTFIVVQKRHHTRFVPDDDRCGVGRGKNVPPGTTVDTVVVHQNDFDYYLCSHEAIQGTCRPSHYYVLYDDNKLNADELQMLTYSMCHTYSRCTRSVSIPSPVYYAHLAAFRARGHILESSGDSETGSSGSGSPSGGRSKRRSLPNYESLSEKMAVINAMKRSMYFC